MASTAILQIPRKIEMNGAVLIGQKHGPDLMALYIGEGHLDFIFDSKIEADIFVADGSDDQPVTSADLLRGYLNNLEGNGAPGTTYFIGGDVGAIKIGRSVNVAVRLKDIQACSPIPVRVLASLSGGDREPLYHRLFAAHRLHGEWFERHPDILAEIDRLNTPSTLTRRVGRG